MKKQQPMSGYERAKAWEAKKSKCNGKCCGERELCPVRLAKQHEEKKNG